MTETADVILDRAADLIDERGLAKGSVVDEDGALCALGAILRAMGYQSFAEMPLTVFGTMEAPLALAHTIVARRAQVDDQKSAMREIVLWNDHPLRTKDDVSGTLRAAANATRIGRPADTVPATPMGEWNRIRWDRPLI